MNRRNQRLLNDRRREHKIRFVKVNSHRAACYRLYTRTISVTSLVYIVIYGTIHTKQHAISKTRELYLSQVWFTLSSMVLFTPIYML